MNITWNEYYIILYYVMLLSLSYVAIYILIVGLTLIGRAGVIAKKEGNERGDMQKKETGD